MRSKRSAIPVKLNIFMAIFVDVSIVTRKHSQASWDYQATGRDKVIVEALWVCASSERDRAFESRSVEDCLRGFLLALCPRLQE